MSDVPATAPDALRNALAGEYAAAFAYGVVGAHVSGAGRDRALRALAAHESDRDQLRGQLAALGLAPPPPAPAYAVGDPVDSPGTAAALAQAVEQRLVPLWAQVAAVSAGKTRIRAARTAIECAVRATAWGAPAQAFPGVTA